MTILQTRSVQCSIALAVLLIEIWVCAGCELARERHPAAWSNPVKFSLYLPDAPLSLRNRPDDTSPPFKSIVPGDEEHGTYTAEILAIEDEYAFIRVQGDTGWVQQSVLWAESANTATVSRWDGTVVREIALPDCIDRVEISFRDNLLYIDNGEWLLCVGITDRIYRDYMESSKHKETLALLESIDVTPWRYCQVGDTIWALDLYRSGVWVVSTTDTIIIDSITPIVLPEQATVTNMAKIGNSILLSGLEYEFSECPLFKIDLETWHTAPNISRLANAGGLIAKIGQQEIFYFERTGDVYHYSVSTGKLLQREDLRINPMHYYDIIYEPEYDYFIGVNLRFH